MVSVYFYSQLSKFLFAHAQLYVEKVHEMLRNPPDMSRRRYHRQF